MSDLALLLDEDDEALPPLEPVGEADPIGPDGTRYVTMSNALIRAGHGLSLSEKRIVALAIAKMDSKGRLRTAPDISRIYAHEYAEAFEVAPNTAYEALQDAAKQLFKRQITFYAPVYKRRLKRGEEAPPPTKIQVRWVGVVKYQDGEGWIELSWVPELHRHLAGIQKHFTTYKLAQTSALRSAYSWKLLELLMRFKTAENTESWAVYDVDDFRLAMDAPPSSQDFAQLKRRIIDPAVKELQAKDGWSIQWKAIKKGRRVASIEFKFRHNDQLRLDI